MKTQNQQVRWWVWFCADNSFIGRKGVLVHQRQKGTTYGPVVVEWNTLVQAPCWPHPLRQILWQVDRILQMQVEVS